MLKLVSYYVATANRMRGEDHVQEMRRKKQLLSNEECIEILKSCATGIMAVNGDDGYPYTVPLNYVYEDGKILFH